MAEVPQNNDSAASDEVKWTTIVYVLIPLATATMTQPVGSVLGADPISKTWLRCSPILCLADTLAFLFEICRLRFFHHLSFRGAVRAVVDERHKNSPDGMDNLATMIGGTLIRWLFFVLGGHGCVLRIGGARNIPWTQLWGFSYVASFVVFEIMVLMVPKELHQSLGAQPKRPYHQRFSASDRTMSLRRKAFAATCVANFALLFYPAHSLVASLLVTDDKLLKVNFAIYLVFLAFLFLYAVCSTVGYQLICMLAAAHPGIAENLCLLDKADAALIRRGQAWYDTGREIWQYSRETDRRHKEFPAHMLTLLPLCFCVAHLALGLLWYRFGYDPSGTKSAGWTGIFG